MLRHPQNIFLELLYLLQIIAYFFLFLDKKTEATTFNVEETVQKNSFKYK